jgi:hypothetical protein
LHSDIYIYILGMKLFSSQEPRSLFVLLTLVTIIESAKNALLGVGGFQKKENGKHASKQRRILDTSTKESTLVDSVFEIERARYLFRRAF